jgi:hypothetical protein
MAISRKPNINNKNLDNFIKDAKDEKINTIEKEPKIDLSSLLSNKPKIFPVTMPNELHKIATETAAKQIPKTSLHDYILIAIKEKIERDTN